MYPARVVILVVVVVAAHALLPLVLPLDGRDRLHHAGAHRSGLSGGAEGWDGLVGRL